MRWVLVFLLVCAAGLTRADGVVVAAKTIRANTILTEADLAIRTDLEKGNLPDLEQILGQEARVILYAGRPIRAEDVAPPAIVVRNQTVSLVFGSTGLNISTIGRALDRGSAGELIRVMNLSSRATLWGVVREDGSVNVSSQ